MLFLHRIYKQFEENQVLTNLSLSISPGEIVGFVGANGSGKTTTMRAIVGLLEIDKGEIVINGQNRTKISGPTPLLGYMPEERGLYQKQEIASQLQYFGLLQGMNRKTASSKASSLLRRLKVEQYQHRLLSDLSLGNQQRVQLVAALIHEPQYLILDEPFSGLDPTGVDALINVLREESSNGVGILFSSHVFSYVQEISDRILILNAGETFTYEISQGSLSQYFHALESADEK